MRLTARSIRQVFSLALLCALLVITGSYHAQEQPQPQPKPVDSEKAEKSEDLGPIEIEIDLDRLIFDNRGNGVQDPVWRIQAGAGKRILLLPFTVDNVHRPNKLARFPLSVRAGRFIGFIIPKVDPNNRVAGGANLNDVIKAAPGQLQQLLFESIKDDAQPDQDTVDSPKEQQKKPTPENAPRLAREITLHPDGTVAWAMSRSFHAAQLQSASEQNLYAYKIDPEQLRAQQPPRPERVARIDGESSRDYAERKRAQQLTDRETQNAYRELRDGLRRLPESFREPSPGVLYAALEIPDNDTLSLDGPAPFPWSLDTEKKQLLNKLTTGGNALQEEQGEQLAGSIVTMIQGHPLDARAIALATMRGRLAGQVKADDPGYEIISRLLQSNDIPTRRIALYGVATVTPPSIASAKLIGVAGEAALGDERKMLSFASLGKLFSTQASDPDTARVLIDRVSQTIQDPEGPAAPQVIEKVLASLSPSPNFNRGQTSDEASGVMIEALDLSGMTKDEFAGVAAAIIRQAASSPIAAGWLDQKLLGSADRDLVNETLSQLYESKIVKSSPQEQIDPATPEPVQDADSLVLRDTIPMTRADHALFALFESDDDLQQAAAWAVLGRFHLDLSEPDLTADPAVNVAPNTPDAQPPVDPTLALFDLILAKADAREKTPASVVAFIVNQKDPALTQVASGRLVALLADTSLAQKTAVAALDAYFATPDLYTQSINQLEAGDRQQLVETMYRSQDQEAPLMAGLIGDRGQTMTWWTNHIKENKQLPGMDDWVELATTLGESTLLQSAASEDDILATAGAAALVKAAGGNAQQEIGFAQTVVLMEARKYELVSDEWNKLRNKILASALKNAAGTYRLVVTLGEQQEGDPSDEPAADQPGKRIDLGVVELKVEGMELSLSAEIMQLSPATKRLGIQLDNPDSLRSFSKPELSAIAPDHLKRPIELLPKDGGVLAGEMALPDGRTFEVSLEPAG